MRSAARRSWPTPTGARAAISTRARPPRKGLAVARMAAHITYLSDAALQRKFGRVCRTARSLLRLRRRFPGRELSAPSGLELRRPLRRQLLSLHHARHGLFRPRRRSWRRAGERLQRHQDALLPRLLHQSIGCSRRGEPRDRAGAQRRRADVSFVEIETDKGHDAFLLDEPELFDTMRGFLERRGRARGLAR